MTNQEMPEFMKGEQYQWPPISNRLAASIVIKDLDIEAQLAAIHRLLQRDVEHDAESTRQIEEFKAYVDTLSGIQNEHGVDQLIDLFHSSVYEDAAKSMAAVGMLAPFFESFFFQAFHGLYDQFQLEGQSPPNHARWNSTSKKIWDCHYHWSDGNQQKGIAKGICELLDATGLRSYVSQELDRILPALFEYRNKMFHCGLEWAVEERTRFAKKIADNKWPEAWFKAATRGREPWVFYMSEEFIKQILNAIGVSLEGLGRFCNENFFENKLK